jgi:hypothetical protein
MLLFVVVLGCERADDISEMPAVQRIMKPSCIRLVSPVFVVELTERRSSTNERTRIRIAPPGTLFAPMSVEDYRSGKAEVLDLTRVLAVLEPPVTLRPVEAWSLVSFEGRLLAIMARVEGGELSGQVVDVASLLSPWWKVSLSDGVLQPVESKDLEGVPLLIPKYAKECEPEGQGAQ